jgi:hypothetical protein
LQVTPSPHLCFFVSLLAWERALCMFLQASKIIN